VITGKWKSKFSPYNSSQRKLSLLSWSQFSINSVPV